MKPGEKIGKLAQDQGISLRKLAITADVPYNTLYAIVKRKSERVDVGTLMSIAKALGVPLHDLVPPEPTATPSDNRRSRILAYYDYVLSPTGQQKAAEAVEIIAGNPEYQKQRHKKPSEAPPAASEGRDTTPAPDGPETPTEAPPEGK